MQIKIWQNFSICRQDPDDHDPDDDGVGGTGFIDGAKATFGGEDAETLSWTETELIVGAGK